MSGGIYTDRGCDPLCFPGIAGSFCDPSGMEYLHGKMRGIQFKRCFFCRVWCNDSGIAAMAFWRHRANIIRLIHGNENKVGAKKS